MGQGTELVQLPGAGASGRSAAGRTVEERVRDHPCYSEEAKRRFGRMHVPVAPACNIQCNYCHRKYDCANESRPGVTSERLTPEQAAAKVVEVARRRPDIKVVGIAGPGDALASAEKTFRTIELVRERAPEMLLCLSTNGLVLPENVERIRRYAIDHVTITINALDPEIGARIYRWVYHQRRRHPGAAGAALLIERQLRGLELLTEAGVLCKVNSVLIPGVNDAELIRLNKAIAERGAFLHNIMPLISAPEHGTAFGLAGQRGPTAEELEELRARCAGAGARIMRHCRQCRSDAVGLLDEGCGGGGLTVLAAPRPAALRVAVASRAGQRVDMHFGQATTFRVYEVTGEQARLVEERAVDKYCQGGYGEEERLDVTIRALHGCAAVLVARVGRCPAEALEKAGIEVVTAHAFEDVLGALAAYHRSRAARPAAP